jgi:VPDSG-CTERM motif
MKRLALLTLVCAFVPLVASAGTVGVNWGNWGTDLVSLTVTYDTNISKSTGAGDVQLTPKDVVGLPNTSFYSFCVDLQHWSQSGVTATLDTMANWNTVQGRNASADQLKGASYLGLMYFSNPRPADLLTRAATQIAIWDLLYESNPTAFSTWNLASGSVKFSNIDSAYLTKAQDLIRGIDTNSTLYRYAGLINTADSADGAYAQNFMAPVPDGGSVAMMLGMALVGLAGLRRMMK